MDIEQLKLILEAAQAAGDGAVQVVFVWFALKFVGLFLKCGLIGGLILGAFRLIRRAITSFSFLEKIESEIGDSFYHESTKRKFLKFLRENWS